MSFVFSRPLGRAFVLAVSALSIASVSASAATVVDRDEFSTTVDVGGGKLKTTLSSEPLNYQTESGAWKPIDLQLEAQADGTVRPQSVDGDLAIPGSLGSPVELEHDGRTATLRLLGASGHVDVSGVEAAYDAAMPGVDVSYVARPYGVKETLTLASQLAPRSFAYELRASELWSASMDRGDVVLRDSAGTERYRISAPLAWDSAADPAFTNALALAVSKLADGRWRVTLRPDAAWLADPARVYPVTIDPDFSWSNGTTHFNGAQDCYLSGYTQANNTFCAQTYLQTGWYNRPYRSLFKFDIAAAIPSNATVNSAVFKAYAPPATPHIAMGHSLHTITSAWDSTATWNNRKAGTPWTTAGGGGDISTNPAYSSSSTSVQAYPAWYSWNAPLATVQGWVNGSLPNYGFMLRSDNTGNIGNAYAWASTEASTSSQFPADSTKWPSLDVTWTIPDLGQRPWQTFTRGDIDRSADVTDSWEAAAENNGIHDLNVNVVTGNLLVREADSVADDAPMVLRYYNSFSTSGTRLGLGWRQNTGPDITVKTAADGALELMTTTGSLLRFPPSSGGGWSAPLDSPESGVEQLTGSRIRVYNADEDVYYEFPSSNSSMDAYSSGDGNKVSLLAQDAGEQSESGLVTSYSHNGAGQLTRIAWGTQQRNYAYASGLLVAVTDEQGTTVRSYQYDSTQRLSRITLPSGWRVDVAYEPPPSRRVVRLTYTSPENVASVVDYSYQPASTVVASGGESATYEIASGLVRSAYTSAASTISSTGSLPAIGDGTILDGTYTADLSAGSGDNSDIADLGIWANETPVEQMEAACVGPCPSLNRSYSVEALDLPSGRVKLEYRVRTSTGAERSIMSYPTVPRPTVDPEMVDPEPAPPTAAELHDDYSSIREGFNLPSDATSVDAALANPAPESVDRWGAPMTQSEFDAIELHQKLTDALTDARDRLQSDAPEAFAGAYVESTASDPAGTVVLRYTAEASDHLDEVRTWFAYPGRLEAGSADVSLARLEQAAGDVEGSPGAFQSLGTELVSATIDERANTVDVAIDPYSTSARDELEARFGPIRVSPGDEVEADAAGGLYAPAHRTDYTTGKLANQRMVSKYNRCSLGYSMLGTYDTRARIDANGNIGFRSNPLVYSLTAGHCGLVALNTMRKQRFYQGGKPYARTLAVAYGYPSLDAMTLKPLKQKFHTRQVWVSSKQARKVVSYWRSKDNAWGQAACIYGGPKQKLECGMIDGISSKVTVTDRFGGKKFLGPMRRLDRPCIQGDSGGVVWGWKRGGVQVFGIIAAGTSKHCYYTSVDEITNTMQARLGLHILRPAGAWYGIGSKNEVTQPTAVTKPRLIGCETLDASCTVDPGEWNETDRVQYAAKLCVFASDCGTLSDAPTVGWRTWSASGCEYHAAVATVVGSNSRASRAVPLEGPAIRICAQTTSCNGLSSEPQDVNSLLVGRVLRSGGSRQLIRRDMTGGVTTNLPTPDTGAAHPFEFWSPDRRRILRVGVDSGLSFLYKATPIDTTVGEIVHFASTTSSRLSCSPDGKKIAIAVNESVYIFDLQSDNYWLVAGGAYDYVNPLAAVSWSPDGQRIAFARSSGSGGDVYSDIIVANADGTGAHPVTSGENTWNDYPRWLPDSSHLAIYRSNTVAGVWGGGAGFVAVMDAQTGACRRVGPLDNRTVEGFDISPDGHSVAYSWSPAFPASGSTSTVLLDIDTQAETTLFAGDIAYNYGVLSWGETLNPSAAYVPPTGVAC